MTPVSFIPSQDKLFRNCDLGNKISSPLSSYFWSRLEDKMFRVSVIRKEFWSFEISAVWVQAGFREARGTVRRKAAADLRQRGSIVSSVLRWSMP
jgi:hypothetical protein